MCGRYILTRPKEIEKRFQTTNQLPLYDASFNIPPATRNPIVFRRSPISIHLAKWGLIPFWARNPKIAYATINARAEGIAEKPVYRKPIRSQRCVVPADGFYEWKCLSLEGKEEKFPWFIGLKDWSLFAFAGIWDTWKDAEGVEMLTYSIVTLPQMTWCETSTTECP